MRCARCNRPMLTPAATVSTHKGAKQYGPKCARAMGILETAARASAPVRVVRQDDGQTDWVAAL